MKKLLMMLTEGIAKTFSVFICNQVFGSHTVFLFTILFKRSWCYCVLIKTVNPRKSQEVHTWAPLFSAVAAGLSTWIYEHELVNVQPKESLASCDILMWTFSFRWRISHFYCSSGLGITEPFVQAWRALVSFLLRYAGTEVQCSV